MRCPSVPAPRTPRSIIRGCFVAALLAVAAQAGAQARTVDSLVPAVGARVRVSAAVPGGAVIGTLVRATQDTLVVAPERGGAALALARADVASFEVSRGRHSRARAGATWAPIGALLFALALGVADGGNPCSADMTRAQCEDESNRAAAGNAAEGAVMGAVVGAAFGVRFRRGERWQTATLPVRVSLTLPFEHARRAAGFAVAVSW